MRSSLIYTLRQVGQRSSLHFIMASSLTLSVCVVDMANAQVLLNHSDGQFSLENRSAADLLDISRGTRTIGKLSSGETWTTEEQEATDLTGKALPLKVDGRIKLEHWGDALNQLPGNQIWSRLMLETAGLDVNRGLTMVALIGARKLSKNITLLRKSTELMGETWISSGPLTPLKAGILSYASRYTPVQVLLTKLLQQIKPVNGSQDSTSASQVATKRLDVVEKPTWPEGYELLPSPRSSLRQAIELHGVKGLSAILSSKEWSVDRGFSDVQLAFALLPEEEVLAALNKRGDQRESKYFINRFNEEKALSDERGPNAAERLIRQILKAREAGDSDGAISYATSTALLWQRHNINPEPGQVAKIVCSFIDMGAQRTINEKQLIAAQAYLTLGQRVCFGHPFYRSRAAEFMRTRGDLSFFDLDLEGAIHWYRAAVTMSDELIDRVRLIDTLARVAIIEISQGNTTLAKAYLKEARRQETPKVPPRDMLVIADDLMPIPDERARIGMIFLIVLLGIGALSQILKVIFGRKKR